MKILNKIADWTYGTGAVPSLMISFGLMRTFDLSFSQMTGIYVTLIGMWCFALEVYGALRHGKL